MANLLTTLEAAKILGVSVDTIRLWERIGKLPAERTSGGIRLFTREAVEKLAADRNRNKASFPQMKDLPSVLDSTGWTWKLYKTPSFPPKDFWLGFDKDGNRWGTKLRGSSYAYREIVCGRLAQRMRWSCQSSAFLRLTKSHAQALGVSVNEVHAAHWFMNEHPRERCSAHCPLESLFGRSVETVDDLFGLEIDHLLDWPKSDFAACLFGANEPPGYLFTTAHEFVIIDSEQIFATKPVPLSGAYWWNRPDGSPSHTGRAVALNVCREFSSLSAADLAEALSIPETVSVRQQWSISERLKASHAFAAEFVASNAPSLTAP